MPQEVELNLNKQVNSETQEQFFRVELRITNGGSFSNIRRRYSIPRIPEALILSHKQWQTTFDKLVSGRSLTKPGHLKVQDEEEDDDAIVIDAIVIDEGEQINCWESYQKLITELNNWLNGDNWQTIRDSLSKYLNELEEEIRVTIQTDNLFLRELPWPAWDIFAQDYPQAEIALSPPEYEPPEGLQGAIRQPQVRILVVLGADDNIDLSFDEKLLNRVREHGGKIEFLRQPSLQELQSQLIAQPGWHIFFFAGHSETNQEGQGVLSLNNNDEEGITIDRINNQLNTAINNGLQLAIFNSCDGLGIANQLADLRLPQSIVMKEPVPNQMAVDFLEHFLDAFSRNKSLFASVHQGREFLRKTYNNPEQYPGGHLLPVIVPNPAVPLPTWKGFLSEYQLPPRYRFPIILAAIVAVIGLPLSIWWEFGWEKLIFYAKLYPHLILFPIFTFWAALWSVYKAFSQVIIKAKFTQPALAFLAACIVLLCIEVTSPNMLLFEFKETAQATIYDVPTEIKTAIETLPNSLIDQNKILNSEQLNISKKSLEETLVKFIQLQLRNKLTDDQISAFHQLMEFSLDYDKVWKKTKNWVSVSRGFYGITFSGIMLTLFTFFALWGKTYDPRQFFSQTKYFRYLNFAQVMIVLWVPLRLYYVSKTKGLLFGHTSSNWFSHLDFFVYPTILVLLIIMVIKLFKTREKLWLTLTTPIIASICLFIGLFQTDLIDILFGLNTIDYRVWIIYPVFIGVCFYLFLNYQDN